MTKSDSIAVSDKWVSTQRMKSMFISASATFWVFGVLISRFWNTITQVLNGVVVGGIDNGVTRGRWHPRVA